MRTCLRKGGEMIAVSINKLDMNKSIIKSNGYPMGTELQGSLPLEGRLAGAQLFKIWKRMQVGLNRVITYVVFASHNLEL